jgi:hypothetical protein
MARPYLDSSSVREARARWRLALAACLTLAVALRWFGFDDPWSGRLGDFHSHFGGFQTGGPVRALAEHGLLESGGMPYDWRVELADGSTVRAWYAHHPAGWMLLSAASLQVFGAHEWALRLPALLGGLFAVWAVAAVGRELFGPRLGLVAAAVVATAPYSVRFGINPWTELTLVGTTALAVRAYARYVAGRRRADLLPAAVWILVGGLLDWPGLFVLPALGLHALFAARRRGGWDFLWPTLCLPAAGLLAIGVHALHMQLVLPAEAIATDKAATLRSVWRLPVSAGRFLELQAQYLVEHLSWPWLVLAILGVPRLVRSASLLRAGLVAVLLFPGLLYVGLFPGRSHDHHFFQVLGLGGLALLAAQGLRLVEQRTGRGVAAVVLIGSMAFSGYRALDLWATYTDEAVGQWVASEPLASLLEDERALILTPFGKGMTLPFYSRAPVVHSVNTPADLERRERHLIERLEPDRRVVFLADLQTASALPEFGRLRAALEKRAAIQMLDTPVGPVVWVELRP